MAVEEERKFQVDPSFTLPDLADCRPAGGRVLARPPVTLTATYYDTVDLRLARAGASLRHRVGDPQPWTVKLPAGSPGVRHEISRSGPPPHPPADLVTLVTATTLGEPLRPVVVLRTRRERMELHDAAGAVLAEVADDTVQVLAGERVRETFRELEVELVNGDRPLLDRVAAVLTGAGAVADPFTPKHVRALGAAAAAPPELPAAQPLSADARAGELVTATIRQAVARITAHDPLVRLRQPLPDGDTPVHKLRVGCRRLRSDLRTFGPLVDPQWADQLRLELRWVARKLGAVRDVEVLRARLPATAADPVVPVDPAAVAHLAEVLATRQEQAYQALSATLAGDRYRALLAALLAAARQPPLTLLATAAATEVLPSLVSGPWQALAYGADGTIGAGDLTADAPDQQWHAVRVLGKQARYAVEAVTPVVGGPAARLAGRLAALQDVLGEHQDAAVAGETWLAIADADRRDHRLAVAAGRLYERERATIRRVRDEFPAAWRAANRRKLVAWLG